ncbi:MAG: DsbA family protein [Halobacteriales archaeon]
MTPDADPSPRASIEVEQFTDPFSPWCWAAQPTLRRLRYEFRADGLTWTPRMTVLLPGSASGGAVASAAPLGDGEDLDGLRARWAEVAATSGMPVADDLWAERVPTSRPACEAIAFVRETVPAAVLAVLRQLREAAFSAGRAIDGPAEVAAVAGGVEAVEATAVERGLLDGRAAAALAADLERAVAVADEVRSGAIETRGDVTMLPAAGRLPAGSGEQPGRTAVSAPRTDPVEDPVVAPEDRSADRQLVAPPALRVTRAAGPAVLVDARLSYRRLASAFGRSVPDTGIEIGDKFATSRMAMHVPREVAESLSGQDFAGEVRPYLARFGRAYLPEIVDGTGLSPATCRETLDGLVARGEVERVGAREWRIIDEGRD